MKTFLLCVFVLIATAASANAAEICGNGIDDDSDGMEDEGCAPGLTTGVCESPLSCGETGMISPSTGSLHYSLPPDVAPRVPWGIGIGLRRFYTSAYDPGVGAPAWKKPMGDRWQHTYMTWLATSAYPAPGTKIFFHASDGRDVLFTYSSSDLPNGYFFTPQPGFHVQSLHADETCVVFPVFSCSITSFTLTLLTGERLIYDASGRLGAIYAPGLSSGVGLTYDGAGQVSTVTDASATRRLLFGYTSNLLTSVQFQIAFNPGTWTTQHTTSYSYTGGVLMSVTIGGELAQQMTYTSNYLTRIADGAGKVIVNFAYDSAVAGRAVRSETQSGMIGVEVNSSRATCSSKTVVYFNLGATGSCTDDSNCATGQLCGGKTGAGATGKCFRGARCLTLTSPSEDLVTTVAPLAPAGQTCDGACTDVAQYIWNTSALTVTATQDPAGYYETRAFNSNGLPVKVSYGDPDSSPDNTNGARTTYFWYDATFPGNVSEIRRKSDLNMAGCADSGSTAGCAQTIITYSAYGKPSQVSLRGTTLSASGLNASYQNDTDYQYDSQGRLTQVSLTHGTATDLTKFEYWPIPNPPTNLSPRDGMLQNIKRELVAAAPPNPPVNITTSATAYDFWGNPTTLVDSDTDSTHSTGTVTCLTFSSARGTLTSRREAMAAQTDCSTPNGADLTTNWTRDSGLRLTQMQRPDGSCMIYEWGHTDSTRPAHLLRSKRRDDCIAASAGERQEYLYDAEGLVTEIQTYDAASVLTAKQPFTYFDSRKLEKMVNPVDTSKFTGFTYEVRGLVSQIDAPGSLGKTVFNRLGVPGQEGRVTSVDRYKSPTLFDSWNLLYDWIGSQEKVTDGDAKATETVRDDLGRVVKLISPDMLFPSVRVYDNANRLVTVVEALGGGAGVQRTHSYSFDRLGRLLAANLDDLSQLAGNCPTGTGHAETIQSFDSPAPQPCPVGMTCSRTGGRLAYVMQTLMCTSDVANYPDGSIDQETFYAYDDAGRLIREYIRDDTNRVADHQYGWTKNGELAQVTLPSTAVVGWTFDSTGNSDKDLISAVWRTNTSTPVANVITWFPYGPLKQYNQQNKISNVLQRTAFARNLAYRITSLAVENQTNGTDHFSVTIAEDAKGRVTKRDYTGAATGVKDSFFLYDDQDRVTCENSTLVSTCPLSGSNLKNNHAQGFTNAGDWKKLLRPIPGSTGLTNDFSLTTGTHQISQVNQSDGTPTFGATVYQYDARGSRTSDNANDALLTHDRRDYTFDARNNLINVHGWYFTGGAWHQYDVASAFDAKNRRVFKQFLDNTTLVKAQWFFYYDPLDRLTEVRYTPNAAVPTTFSTFQLFWLGRRLVLYWQTDSPSGTTSKRYVGTDETGRPIDMWTWPASGNGARAWAINPSAWASDSNVVGPSVFQPVLFAGQYLDTETIALQDPTGGFVHRPGVALNGMRTYDPFTGAYLQVDPLVSDTWSSYVAVDSNPVGKSDSLGLAECQTCNEPSSGGGGSSPTCGSICEVVCNTDYIPDWGCDCESCFNFGGGGGGGGTDACPGGTGKVCTVGDGGALMCWCMPDDNGGDDGDQCEHARCFDPRRWFHHLVPGAGLFDYVDNLIKKKFKNKLNKLKDAGTCSVASGILPIILTTITGAHPGHLLTCSDRLANDLRDCVRRFVHDAGDYFDCQDLAGYQYRECLKKGPQPCYCPNCLK